MEKMFIGVRDVDGEIFRKFKAMTAEEQMKLGQALTKAMQKMLNEEQQKKRRRKNPLLKLRPFSFGKGTERLSKEIDQTLYG